ncbi:inositol 1,4,5-trisphosphate-gated calcium channel ITPR2-like isoform X12 [Mytilus edulis]|uniref:inositol 1,4,5-trisphosphate-gated calcium channel ITPR2-like isoform X12 n=1 Tax=Mytilus edulis TaxID=6550 RepID=UPI0039EFE447
MTETDEMESILATRRPYLFLPGNDSVQSSRHSVLSQDTEQQIRMYSRMLRQINKELHGYNEEPGMGEYLCIGDYVCLYCEETEGYVYSSQSSSSNNGLYVYTGQERNRPRNVPNQQVVVFQVCIQNRYKLNKKYRKLLNSLQTDSTDCVTKGNIAQTKLAAEAENKDNEAEQKRQHGKRVRYGEVFQLRHMFTNKFVHMSTTQTSQQDKNNMKVSLHDFNAKNAQFRILPRYKVKSEGEIVQLFDQIVFESMKSPGHYFHTSESYQIDHFTFGSELNLGVERSSYTLIGSYREIPEQERFVRGGSVLRLFHKELEAYLVAEGLFDDCVTEDVHFRIRVIDQHRPKSLSPSSSGITYWQIEAEHSILDGDILRWEQQVRLRHMLTRQYLCIDSKLDVSLVPDPSDPRTVFRLHSVLKERDEIQFESYARIEHMLTGCWLHALKDEDYERQISTESGKEKSMSGLRWDSAAVRKVSASSESMYDDAYTIQQVMTEDTQNFNYVAGIVPFLFNLIQDLENNPNLNAKKTHGIITALREVKLFMVVDGLPYKDRQKLMRNLRVIDLLVNLLQCPLREGDEESHMIRIFKEAYDVLHAYMIGKSRKNALYFAKYIDFFQTQFTQKGGIGLNVAQMIVELIRDKRKIVDRITEGQIATFIKLLRETENYRFLDLLQVLCVCDGVSIPNNQTYIVEHWLRGEEGSVYLTDRGQNINKRPNIVYLATERTIHWLPLHVFVDPESAEFNEDKYQFLLHQLELFKALCFGRNDLAVHVITREHGYLTWEDAYLCLTSDLLPDCIRAKYCELIIALFVDVGNNYSVLDHPNICFIYEYVGSKDSDRDQSFVVKDLVTIFPVLRDWLAEFLRQNNQMTASDIGHNQLVEQVLRLLQHLVKFGYYNDMDDVKQLLTPLLSLLDGGHDVPFPKDKAKGYTKEGQKAVNTYRASGRFEKSQEAEAVVNAKYQAMEVLDFLLTFQRNLRLKAFVTKFKHGEQNSFSEKKPLILEPLMYETYNPHEQVKKALRHQKKVIKELKEMFSNSSIFEIDSTTLVVMDLSNYKYDRMVTKSLDILNKLYSSQMDMFQLAAKAQILLTQDSARVHRELQRSLPVLRRLAKQKLNDHQILLMGEILDELAEFCHLPKTPEEPHFMNQNILISHGILAIVKDILSQEIDTKLVEQQYQGMKKIFSKTLWLMKLLARENKEVQEKLFQHLDTLLSVQIVPSDLALALKELFVANQSTCLKVSSKQIQKIVLLAADYQQEAPEFLELLNVLVKVDGLDLTIKRNQALVMKYIMQNYRKAAYVLDQPRDMREQILTNKREKGHLAYYVRLVDLLATCAEGENKFIESLCQTILPVQDLLWVMNHISIDNNLKKPFVKFMIWVYMKPVGNLVESGGADLQHDKDLWDFISAVAGSINQISDTMSRHSERTVSLLKSPPDFSFVADEDDPKEILHGNIFFILDAVLPFLEVFYSIFYSLDKDLYPTELDHTDTLASGFASLCESIGSLLTSPAHMKSLVATVTILISSSTAPKSANIGALDKFTQQMRLADTKSDVRKGNMEYYCTELELNAKFHTFAKNNRIIHRGHNTVQAQMKYKCKREYTEIGTNEELPLGEEFQSLVKCFCEPHEKNIAKKFQMAKKLLQQLEISSRQILTSTPATVSQEDLDIKCLQILRTFIHQEERKLRVDWDQYASDADIKKQLANIKEVQTAINSHDFVGKVLPHIARRSDAIVREVLAFLSLMLFNANRDVQKSLLEYFLSTREEVFFMAVRDRMQISTNSIKEKFLARRKHQEKKGRSLLAQHQARVKDIMSNLTSFQSSISAGKRALQMIQTYELRLKRDKMQGWSALSRAKEPLPQKKRKKSKKKKKPPENRKPPNLIHSNGISRDNSNEALLKSPDTPVEYSKDVEMVDVSLDDEKAAVELINSMDDGVGDMLEYKDDGYIELVLKLLARVCDGQNTDLQTYMREQPDNVKSFNIVGETAQFLNVVYSTVNSKTIALIIQIFSTLNEFCAGNQENRVVVYDRKVVDYINFILRAGDIADCPPEKILELRESISSLIISLIEENGPGNSQVAKEVKDTIDKAAVYRCMTSCYTLHQTDKPKLEDISKTTDGSFLQPAKSIAALGGSLLQGVMKGKNTVKDTLMDVGFSYYLILARMNDIDPHLSSHLKITPEQQKAFDFYKKNSSSIEIVKDDVLQKVNFRVKNKNYLRDQVKEKIKWTVDRSSPSNKIRDIIRWTKDIMQDISYQRKILHNPIAMMFTKGWLLWNYGAIFLSFAINLLMLITWNAQASLEDVTKTAALINGTNVSTIPWNLIADPKPKIEHMSEQNFSLTMYVLGGVHNLFSLMVLVSYFLSNHPRFPSGEEIKASFRALCGKKANKDDIKDKKQEEGSRLDAKFFSFLTFYYMVFLGMSVLGTYFHGYFFAFHLLNIVNNNQLLSGVIKAVTLNGISLLWVAILGLIVIYIYALVGFSLLRMFFNPGEYLYCSTLWQCTITVMRYGLIGDMFESVKQTNNNGYETFDSFWPLVLYHVSFFIFITTIGLNIIFGIIVDTFSELRDLKWRAESDMKDTCFICSRNSYDFEHNGKGFEHHVRNEHNMWSYVFFIIHLDSVKTSDYTALELYVSKSVGTENYEFFPMNRALCLSSIDIDSTESKIDDLLSRVTSIAMKQKEEETEKKRKIEKMKQKRWQEKHRQFMFGLSPDDNDRGEGNGDPENDTFLGPQLRISDRPLSRPPSILSLQSRRRTDTPGGTSSRKDDIDRRESELGLSQFLTSKLLKEKKAAAARDDDTPSVSDSDAGSVEGSYDIMARETSPPGSQSFDFLAQPPPVRDRAFSVPVIVTPARLLAEASRDDIDEEEEEDKEEYSTRL